MPKGSLNEVPIFYEMTMKLQMEWDTLLKEHRMNNFSSKLIVGDVLLYGRTSKQLLECFRTFLEALKHHRTTLKLKW